MSIKDWPERERPREKLLASGTQALSDAELLAVLLGGAGTRGLDAVATARNLIARHQTLRGLLSATQQLWRHPTAISHRETCCPDSWSRPEPPWLL